MTDIGDLTDRFMKSKSISMAPHWQRIETKDIKKVVTVYGILLMIFGAICYSMLVVTVKWASNLGYESMQILIFKATTQISIAIPMSLINCRQLPPKCEWNSLKNNIRQMSFKLWIFVLFRGIFGALTTIFYFDAITKLPIGDAIAIYSMYPIPTAFVSYCALKERISWLHVIALILCVVGTMLIVHPKFIFNHQSDHLSKDTEIGYITAIISAVLMSGVFIFIRLAKKAPTTILIIAQGLSCIVEAVIIGLLFQNFYGLYTLNDYLCLCSIGLVGYCAQFSLTRSSQILPSALASILRSTEILWTYLCQIFIFHQMPTYLTIIGVVVILLAIFIVIMEKFRNERMKRLPVVPIIKEDDEYSVNKTMTFKSSLQSYNTIQ